MSSETKHYCDNCCKEVWHSNCASIVVKAQQGPGGYNAGQWSLYRQQWAYMLCEECLGEKITTQWANSSFNLSDACQIFLKKFGFIKENQDENTHSRD